MTTTAATPAATPDAYSIAGRAATLTALQGIAGWNSFAASLVRQYRNKAALTSKQWDAAVAMLAKMEANAAARATAQEKAPEVDVSRIAALLSTAKASKLRAPKFHAGGLTFSFAPATGVNAGAVYVKRDDTYLGKIKEGRFIASTSADENTDICIERVAEDPLGEAIRHGKLTGRCSCCNRKLSDDTNKGSDGLTSIERGIGPVCMRRFGLVRGA